MLALNYSEPRDSENTDSEQGIVIIILVAALVGILAFLALAVDLSRYSSAKSKQHETIQLAAIASLKAFQETTSTAATQDAQYIDRLTAALDRAEQILGFSENSLAMVSAHPQLTPTANELREGSGILTGRTSGLAGVFTPGTWFFDQPTGGCSSFGDTASACPCPGAVWRGECFRPNTNTETQLTAIEISLDSTTTSPLQFLFGRVLGTQSSGVRSRARASMRPRVFLTGIDRSRSITFDTHKPWDGTTGAGSNRLTASEYVFPLDTNFSQCTAGSYQNPCLANQSWSNLNAGCRFLANDFFHVVWYSMERQRNDALLYPKRKHFRDDYTCWVIDGKHYLIDTAIHGYNDSGGSVAQGMYRGPEPLVTILRSFRTAIDEMEARTVPGDMISLFPFDQEVDTTGPHAPINKFNIAAWQDLKNITSVDSVTDFPGHLASGTPHAFLQSRIMTHEMFPRPPDSFTDLAEAIFAATRTIDDLIYLRDANVQFTFLTDGLANVNHNCASCAFIVGTGKDKWMEPDDPSGCTPNDRNFHPHQNCWFLMAQSVTEAVQLATKNRNFYSPANLGWFGTEAGQDEPWQTLADRGIKLNFALFSQQIQPHTVLKKDPLNGSKCMDDLSARKNDSHITIDSDYYSSSSWPDYCYATLGTNRECPYTTGADFIYRGMVMPTGGMFVPIRPRCDPGAISAILPAWGITDATCGAGELLKKFDSQLCELYNEPRYLDPDYPWELTVGWDEDLRPLLTQLQTAGVVDNNFWSVDSDDTSINRNRTEWGWAYGTRVVCDPLCRTPENQLRDLYRELFRTNPFVRTRDER